MWLVVARDPKPDAQVWPGRRVLGLLDAVAWPAAVVIGVSLLPRSGLIGAVISAVVVVIAGRQAWRALFRNERYRFLTPRIVAPVMVVAAVGALLKAFA